jgi:hypothetical protein
VPLALGSSPKENVLLALTFLVSVVTHASGRTHAMLGAALRGLRVPGAGALSPRRRQSIGHFGRRIFL